MIPPPSPRRVRGAGGAPDSGGPAARPVPRPALRRAPDGAVHPATPRREGPSADLPPRRGRAGKGKDAKDAKDRDVKDRDVTLVVHLPKALRRDLRRKAEAAGYTAEEALAALARAWVEH